MRFAELAEIIERHLGPTQGRALLEQICREAAGESVYIPQRHGRPEIHPTDTPAQIARRHGVSRATAYNWVNKWRQ